MYRLRWLLRPSWSHGGASPYRLGAGRWPWLLLGGSMVACLLSWLGGPEQWFGIVLSFQVGLACGIWLAVRKQVYRAVPPEDPVAAADLLPEREDPLLPLVKVSAPRPREAGPAGDAASAGPARCRCCGRILPPQRLRDRYCSTRCLARRHLRWVSGSETGTGDGAPSRSRRARPWRRSDPG